MPAFVAFDLDNTLGSFDLVGPWSGVFSVEALENERHNSSLTPALKRRLREAESLFIDKIKANRQMMNQMFRPNLDALIMPLVKAKQTGKIRAVCMYSNTFQTVSMYFAKRIIEERYACPGFFDCLVDSTHPIRKYDWDQNKGGTVQPLKTFHGLKKIFKILCGVKDAIQPENVLFVDDRTVKHHLEAEETNGLTYLQVNSYVPEFSEDLRKLAYLMGLQVLLETNLVDYEPFLSSNIFSEGDVFTHLKIVETDSLTPFQPPQPFKNDTPHIRKTVLAFLKKIERGDPHH